MNALRRYGRRVADLLRYGVAGAPVSITVLVAVWVLGFATDSILHAPGQFVYRHLAVGIGPIEHWRLWTPLTAGLWAHGLAGYLGATALVFLVAAPLERRMGSGRFAISAVVTQIAGTALGLAVAALVKLLDADWGFRLHIGAAVGPTTWIAGVAMVASASMDTLWRRRIRVGLLALTITLVLFAGQLQDVIRLGAVVVGLCVGLWIVGRSARGQRITGTRREGRVLVAIVVAATSIGTMLAALSPHAVGPLAVLRDLFRGVPWTAAEVREICEDAPSGPDCRRGQLDLRLSGIGPTLLSLMPSVFLLVLCDGLRRGRRFAWIASTVAQVVLLVLSLLNFVVRYIDFADQDTIFYGLDAPNVYRTLMPFLTPLALLILLLATRKLFDVQAPPKTYRRLFGKVAVLVVGLGVLYVLGGLWARSGFDRHPTVTTLIADFPQRLVPPVYLQLIDPRLLPVDWAATLLYEWTGVVFWVVACVLVAATFLRPAHGGESGAAERARQILTSGSGSALSWMTTWDGNSYWFGPGGDSYVAYRVIGGVALTTGGPVGRPDRVRDDVAGFAEFAAANGWVPCFYSVTADVRDAAHALGWVGVQVAEETVLDLGSIAFTGKKFQDVRTALNKAAKWGITAEWITFRTAPLAITDQITAISEEWVADKGMPEMGFTLGGLQEMDDPEVRCLIAVDEHRTVHGVTSWLPVYRDGRVVGWTLDFMRRRADGPQQGFRPAMEFLIASAALLLEQEGAEFVSLSGAPLATVSQDVPATASEAGLSDVPAEVRPGLSDAMDSVLEVLGQTLEPVYGFRSLLAFKSKFQPRYEPMYMCFADPVALPSIGNAIGRAYLPDVSFGQGMRLVRTLIRR
ncbi:phosphatidylglycerol lysyltransferase domain-containing protein [Rhodococcus sp. ACT016]|uniref:phosphatidylglycerol lysyltransferase domain-containing protein n=1 Tax=Rhodococcus sp. ACT016 TaxID=3134808 RepID=UPI003D2D0AA8